MNKADKVIPSQAADGLNVRGRCDGQLVSPNNNLTKSAQYLMKPVRLEKELELSICTDYEKGMLVKDISEKYSVSRATVNNVRCRYNLPNRYSVVDDQLKTNILNLFEQGASTHKIGKSLKTDRGIVSKVIKERYPNINLLGVQHEANRLVKANPFTNLNDDATSYFLGLLATDGCIDERNRVSLGLTDLDIIQKFCTFLKTDLKIHTYNDPRYEAAKPVHSVKFTNAEITDYLIGLGLTPRKTSTLQVNFPLNFSFLRGVIDGDGSVRQESEGSVGVFISNGSKNFCEQIAEFLIREGITPAIYNSSSTERWWTLRIGKKEQVTKLYHALYDNATVFMERKRKGFDPIR